VACHSLLVAAAVTEEVHEMSAGGARWLVICSCGWTREVLVGVGGAERDEAPPATCSRQRRARHQDRAATERRLGLGRIAAGSVLVVH